MPVSFDFLDLAASAVTYSGSGAPRADNVADGVTFTVTGSIAGGSQLVRFGNGDFPDAPLLVSDGGDDNDGFGLFFAPTASPSFHAMTGTAGAPVVFSWGDVTGTWVVRMTDTFGSFLTTTTITALDANGALSWNDPSRPVDYVSFRSTGPGPDTIVFNGLSGNGLIFVLCFCEGTRIDTPTGPVAVEALRPGDRVLTADGAETRVRWLGRRRVAPRTQPGTAPVRIRAGALGGGLPRRDLRLSQDHALALDGCLVTAGALIDGYGVVREPAGDAFTYYHVETDRHELILAEGAAAETYLDQRAADGFDNAAERKPRVVAEMDLPRVSAPRLAATVRRVA
ncbi:Hint domain-containing protein [Psychromarinibacter halotolerans]|uniref:Hint domain-containing protein n=1 Tax=Psychromarinibacter halotolerans TaxID=1775175 RepID=A0ABV7GY03_9RHOB|nr:Hint domain-containing protein [Psychromarinibacter halotolerans]MDF0598340.1 Hint domain-containing protein [Psychromarinibacter halotolerans]